ncbi:MAG: D-2-hydroxyacid dehydrogenase [Acutalibacter sp.]|nr:D-2-hydroxyacid dehydrogenase [Acutalibacter sp.]
MKSYHILIVIPLEQRQKKLLEETASGCEVRVRSLSGDGPDSSLGFTDLTESPALTEEDMEWADILLGNVSPAMLEKFSRLQWMQTGSAGVEGYLKLPIWKRGTILTNSTGAYGLAISEHMLGTLLEILKKLELYRDAQKTGSWNSQGRVKSIWNSTVLVLGMGDIGSEFGKRCKALGAKVIGIRRTDRAKPDFADEVATLEKLDDLLPQADVVAITLPGTEATKNLFHRERMERMKDGAVLLNVGRGSIVDTEALCDALESGKLWGAGLDVTDPEPLPPDHRLWSIPTAVITPHVSGYYHLKETHERIFTLFAENLKRFLAEEPLHNQIDLSAGYRKLN